MGSRGGGGYNKPMANSPGRRRKRSSRGTDPVAASDSTGSSRDRSTMQTEVPPPVKILTPAPLHVGPTVV